MPAKKKQYCIYRRLDLIGEYLLVHPSKPSVSVVLQYDYSDPYSVYLADSSKRQLDSLTNIQGYKIDTSYKSTGYAYEIEGNCQYCDYYKSLYLYNVCEYREE